jgi:hypothetical protein
MQAGHTSIAHVAVGHFEQWQADEAARQVVVNARSKRGDRDLKPEKFVLPDIPELHRVPQRIADEDERELRWFLSDPRIASIAASTGAFGNQLEQAASFGFGALPCKRCGGKHRSRKRSGKAAVVEWQDGTGMAPKDRFGKRVTYSVALAGYRRKMQKERNIVLMSKPEPKAGSGIDADAAWQMIAEKFRGEGKQLMTETEFRALFDQLPDELCQPCRECSGIGVVPRRSAAHAEVTVFPTGSSKQLGGREGDSVEDFEEKLNAGEMVEDGSARVSLQELDRFWSVRSILVGIGNLSPIARVAIEEYYSVESGQRALEELAGEFWGLSGAARMRAASALRDHSCGCYQLAAFGAST